jgi:hypothetical protein
MRLHIINLLCVQHVFVQAAVHCVILRHTLTAALCCVVVSKAIMSFHNRKLDGDTTMRPSINPQIALH